MFKPTLNYGPNMGQPPSPTGMPRELAAYRPGTEPWVRAAEPSMGTPVGTPRPQPGAGSPPMMGSLRPKPKLPAAGLNEPKSDGWLGGSWLTSLLNNMIGGKGMVVSKPTTQPQPQPQAGLPEQRAGRAERAAALMNFGAGLMD